MVERVAMRFRKAHLGQVVVDGKRFNISFDPVLGLVIRKKHARKITAVPLRQFVDWHVNGQRTLF